MVWPDKPTAKPRGNVRKGVATHPVGGEVPGCLDPLFNPIERVRRLVSWRPLGSVYDIPPMTLEELHALDEAIRQAEAEQLDRDDPSLLDPPDDDSGTDPDYPGDPPEDGGFAPEEDPP
ncbi:MAG: hypothetical protein ACREEC_07745 [Thermoplasmata archaeon]